MNKIPQTQLKILEFLAFLKKQKIENKISFEKFKTYAILSGLPIAPSNYKAHLNFIENLGIIIMSDYDKSIKINQDGINNYLNIIKKNYELTQKDALLITELEANE